MPVQTWLVYAVGIALHVQTQKEQPRTSKKPELKWNNCLVYNLRYHHPYYIQFVTTALNPSSGQVTHVGIWRLHPESRPDRFQTSNYCQNCVIHHLLTFYVPICLHIAHVPSRTPSCIISSAMWRLSAEPCCVTPSPTLHGDDGSKFRWSPPQWLLIRT